MTPLEFLQKYPWPWKFVLTDPSGSGAIVDANEQILARLCTDIDWKECLDDPCKPDELLTPGDAKYRPVFNGGWDDPGGMEEEREVFLALLTAGMS